MPRPQRNDIATKQLHKAVKKLQRRNPDASTKDVERWVLVNHGLIVNPSTIRKAFDGNLDPLACGVEGLAAIELFFGAAPGELGEAAEARLAPFRGLRAPDEGIRRRGCNGDSPYLRPTSKPAVAEPAMSRVS